MIIRNISCEEAAAKATRAFNRGLYIGLFVGVLLAFLI